MPDTRGARPKKGATKPVAKWKPNTVEAEAPRKRGPRVFQKSLDKRQVILASAAKVFKEKGYSEASLSMIAKEAGTFAGALYYYFESKNHLVDELLTYAVQGIDELHGVLDSLPDGTSYRERIRLALSVHLKQALQRDDFFLAYHRIIDQIPPELRERHLTKPYIYNDLWEDLISGAIKAGEIQQDTPPSVVRMLLLGATTTGIDWFHLGIDWFHLGLDIDASLPSDKSDQLADKMVTIVFEGVGLRPSGSRSLRE